MTAAEGCSLLDDDERRITDTKRQYKTHSLPVPVPYESEKLFFFPSPPPLLLCDIKMCLSDVFLLFSRTTGKLFMIVPPSLMFLYL